MSKYNSLWEYVQKSGKDSFQLTFEEIQETAGIPMDHSFLKYKKELADHFLFWEGLINAKCKACI